MQLAWITDPHLNHVPELSRVRWLEQIASHGHDGVVISGDISESEDVVFHLNRITSQLAVPVYFVLGNHDFYRSSIDETRQNVICACRENPQLHYLTDSLAVEAGDVCIVGDDGWGDATCGDFERSYVRLNDFVLIEDFRTSNPHQWKEQLHELGKASAERLEAKLIEVPDSWRDVLVVTHVPPFREACLYQDKIADDNWAPFFVSGQVGQVLRRLSTDRPNQRFTVLCGHSHHAAHVEVSANLIVHTGAATYGLPQVEGVLSTSTGKLSLSTAGQRDS